MSIHHPGFDLRWSDYDDPAPDPEDPPTDDEPEPDAREWAARGRATDAFLAQQHKRCTGCGQYKPLSDFYHRHDGQYGRDHQCKTCVKAGVTRRSQGFIQRRLDRPAVPVSAADISGRAK